MSRYDKAIDAYRKRREMRLDGGDGSGNWGHVGRPGERGGSQPGGGSAFRLTKGNASKLKTVGKTAKGKAKGNWADKKGREKMSKFTSKALIRRNLMRDMKSEDFLTKWKAEEKAEKVDMQVKSALSKEEIERRGLSKTHRAVDKLDHEANKHILESVTRGKTTGMRTPIAAKGTKELVRSIKKK